MVSVREWEQSAAACGRMVDEAMKAGNYDEARRCLARARRHALCALRLREEINDAWVAYECEHIAGDNPRCFPHIYFERGFEAGLSSSYDREAA